MFRHILSPLLGVPVKLHALLLVYTKSMRCQGLAMECLAEGDAAAAAEVLAAAFNEGTKRRGSAYT